MQCSSCLLYTSTIVFAETTITGAFVNLRNLCNTSFPFNLGNIISSIIKSGTSDLHNSIPSAPVSYTHLDVYKRQVPMQSVRDLPSQSERSELHLIIFLQNIRIRESSLRLSRQMWIVYSRSSTLHANMTERL